MKFKSSAALVAIAAIVAANGFSCSSEEPMVVYGDEAGFFEAGSIRLALTVGGSDITSVTAVISGKHDFVTQTHTIDVTGETGVVSIFFGDLPAQHGYKIRLTAGECTGSADFNIDADKTTLVPVTILCPGADGDNHHRGTGNAQVTGTIVPGAGPDCDLVTKMVAAPSTQDGNGPISNLQLFLNSGVGASSITWTQSSVNGGLGVIGGLVGATDREVTFDCNRNGTVVMTAAVTSSGAKTSCTEQARVSIECINQVPGTGAVCGNGVVEGTEQCDGTAGVGLCPVGQTGTVTCNPGTCTRNFNLCVGTSLCGNGNLDAGEQCDGPLGVGVCPAGTTGTVTCNAGVCTKNTTGCVVNPALCGNGALDAGEQCDGPLGVGVCPAGTTGTVTCNAVVCTKNTTGCAVTAGCGNNQLDSGEECDGTLGIGTCPGGTSGTMSCTSLCKKNYGACAAVTCGNGVLDAAEQCDGSLGLGSCPAGTTGTVSCLPVCLRNFAACTPTTTQVCGNGTVEGTEQCDGTVGVGTCPAGTTGTVTCNAGTCTRNTSACVNTCGNGVVNPGEECDGTAGIDPCPAGQTGTVTCTPQCTENRTACHTGGTSGACQASCVEDLVNNGLCAGFFNVVQSDSDAVIDCVFGTDWPARDKFNPTSCVAGAKPLNSCFCGSTAPATCFVAPDPATLADAPCLSQMIQADGCSGLPVAQQVPCVAKNFVDPSFAGGRAMQYAQCLQDNCGDICFP